MNPDNNPGREIRVFRRRLFLAHPVGGFDGMPRRVREHLAWPKEKDGTVVRFRMGEAFAFADGCWFYRVWTEPTIEDAARQLREAKRGFLVTLFPRLKKEDDNA